MTWDSLDWSILDRLRTQFLDRTISSGAYWRTSDDLAAYDLTYGERIGWKWDAVLAELRLRQWKPTRKSALRVMDWGCGSGIAGRRVTEWLGTAAVGSLSVWDHSEIARRFAAERAREQFPGLDVRESAQGEEASDILVVSHVLNELSPDAEASLFRCMAKASAILWVEPGTHAVARALQRHHDKLLGAFLVVAPCTHQAGCGLNSTENEQHWCHHFAPPPAGIHSDGNWVRFGQRAGIDLRSLPYSLLVLDRTPPAESSATPTARVIGRPEAFKPYVRLLGCEQDGVRELSVHKRDCPDLFRQLQKNKGPLLYTWRRQEARIVSGTTFIP
ncbi:MAG: hypothetical protein HS122_00165 [Opitutaceae bacterium]|nr:hypothetical protein [Opitutaceae bacterium]